MSFSESDFSSNEELDNIQVGDATVDVVGSVCRVSDNFDCKGAKNKYIKIVLNNNAGRQIQVTAWNNLTHLLEEIKEIDKIVYVGNVKAQKVTRSIYNHGNMDIELIVKENSCIEVCGSISKSSTSSQVVSCSIIDAYSRIGAKVEMDAYIKNSLRFFKNQEFVFYVGAITDGEHKLEIKINTDHVEIPLDKGDSVHVVGVMERYPPGPPVLNLESENGITIIEKKVLDFDSVYNGYRNKL